MRWFKWGCVLPVQIQGLREYDTYEGQTIVQTPDAFESMVRRLNDATALCVDYETSGTAWFRHAQICGIALGCWDDSARTHAYYVPVRHQTADRQLPFDVVGPAVQRLLGNPETLKIAHNLKFEDHFTRREGWVLAGPRYDTMMAAHLYDENRLINLKDRAENDLGWPSLGAWEKAIDVEIVRLAKAHGMGKREYKDTFGYAQIAVGVLGPYACFDIAATIALYLMYEQFGISTRYPQVWKTEMELTSVLCGMEQVGMPIDQEYLSGLKAKASERLYDLKGALDAEFGGGINYGSDADVRRLLFEELRLPPTKLTSAKVASVDKEVLTGLRNRHVGIPLLLEYRQVDKILSTYTGSLIKRLDAKGYVHTDFRPEGTVTGRFSSRNPNLQNITSDSSDRKKEQGEDPWSIQRAFVVRPGWVRLFLDYSQIELRILAYYSGDPILNDTFAKGEDAHDRTSIELFGTTEKDWRRRAKSVNFGLSYGLTAPGLAKQINVSEDEAQSYLDKFNARYAGVDRFRNSFWAQCRQNNGEFQNRMGRPRRLPGLNSERQFERGRAERQAIATLIQGTAAELMKVALVRLDRFIRQSSIEAYLVSTVHDEAQIDCAPEAVPTLIWGATHLMEAFPEFRPVPIKVDAEITRTNWADKEEFGAVPT